MEHLSECPLSDRCAARGGPHAVDGFGVCMTCTRRCICERLRAHGAAEYQRGLDDGMEAMRQPDPGIDERQAYALAAERAAVLWQAREEVAGLPYVTRTRDLVTLVNRTSVLAILDALRTTP